MKPDAFNYNDFLRLEKEHEELKEKYERCRNELCLRCGQYTNAHNIAVTAACCQREIAITAWSKEL